MRYVVLSFCVFAAACAGAAPSAPTSRSSPVDSGVVMDAQGGSELPLLGTLQATETEVGAVRHLVGTGNATQLGRFSLSAEFTVDTTTGTASGTAAWTAANGDQFVTSLTGHAVVTFPNAAITETDTITGGTGRFSAATGTILLQRSLNLLTGVSSASISGTISLGH